MVDQSSPVTDVQQAVPVAQEKLLELCARVERFAWLRDSTGDMDSTPHLLAHAVRGFLTLIEGVAASEHPDTAGHVADEVRDACLAVIGRVVTFDASRQIAGRVIAKIAALSTPPATSPAIPEGKSEVGVGGVWGKWHIMLLALVNAIHRDEGVKTRAIGIELSYQHALAALTPDATQTREAEGSEIGRALREVPDEAFRHIVDAKDVGHARARIAALIVDLRAALNARDAA